VSIQDGPLAEDEDEVRDFLHEFVEELGPRDTLEVSRANRVAMLHLQERRLEALETMLVGSSPFRADTYALERDEFADD
jgi:hypothetical protein